MVVTFGEVQPIIRPTRERDPDHLRRVKSKACCIPGCRRGPCDAHHLTFAQPRARGLKVGDQFTVPLCHWTDHDPRSANSVHFMGDERDFWARFGIDPLPIAARLWAETLAIRSGKP